MINLRSTDCRMAIFLPDLRGGGAERVAINLANNFAQRGYAVDMVLLSSFGELLTDLSPDVRIIDLKVKRLRNTALPLVAYLRENRPSILLACMWPLTVIALWAKSLACVKTQVIVAEHATWSGGEIVSSPFVHWQVRTTMHYFFPKAAGIVVVSNGSADVLASFANLDRSGITVIYNPVVGNAVSLQEKAETPKEWCEGMHYKLLAVGTLKPIKDYSMLLNAIAQLKQRINIRLLILGEGQCRAALEAQAQKLGIADRLFMPGFVKDPSPYYHHADLHVLSSVGEGLPTVIIEALAAGTPVVSTDCPSGPREILCGGQFGLLVPVGDATALALAIEKSLGTHHDPLLLKMRAQDFSIDKAVDHYEKLFFGDSGLST